MNGLTQRVHFISGLPRSGSTLLSALFRQNTNYHASISSPVASLMSNALEQMGAGSEFYTFFDDAKRRHISRSIFSAYYHDHLDKEIVFDTNRIWTARMHQLVELFSDFKVICLVRNPAWVMDSFERIYRKNPFDYSRMFSAVTRQTVYSRCESLMAGGTVGVPWTALKEAYYGEHSERLLLVDYEILTRFPERAMKLIYEFINEPEFAHNFDEVDFSEGEFDAQVGVKGLHDVKKKVEFVERKTILPPELFAKYSDMAFWQDQSGTSASIIAPKSKSEKINT